MRYVLATTGLLGLVLMMPLAQQSLADTELSASDNFMVQEFYTPPSCEDLNLMAGKLEDTHQLILKINNEIGGSQKRGSLAPLLAKVKEAFYSLQTALAEVQVGCAAEGNEEPKLTDMQAPSFDQPAFRELKYACARLYSSVNKFAESNSQQPFLREVRVRKVKKLEAMVIDLAKSGHILIMP